MSRAASQRTTRLRIMVFGPNRWHGPWMNRQQLFSRLGKRHDVLYVGPLPSSPASRARTTQTLRWATSAADDVLVDQPPLWGRRAPAWPSLDRIILRLGARQWRRSLRGRARLIAYVFTPGFWPYVRAVRPDFLVYHIHDLLPKQAGWTEASEVAHRRLCRAADLVVVSAESLLEHARAMGARDPQWLPNGVDFEQFAEGALGSVPDDLASIPRPRIGYIGARLNEKVDVQLVRRLAERRSHWHFVLIGELPSSGPVTADLAALRTVPNVHLLGMKDWRSLPMYTGGMDANLLCYRLGDDTWTAGIYPLKLHEYLAAGHPVVSADVPSVRAFQDVVWIAESPDEWEVAIEASLRGEGRGTVDERRQAARANTWDSRVAVLDGWLSRLPELYRPGEWQERDSISTAMARGEETSAWPRDGAPPFQGRPVGSAGS